MRTANARKAFSFGFMCMSLGIALLLVACTQVPYTDRPAIPNSTSTANLVVSPTQTPREKGMSEKLTETAWEDFNKSRYEAAITGAGLCIEQFRGDARRIEQDLISKNAEVPNGSVSVVEAKMIFQNGVLNDVATCMYIRGSALERLLRKQEAKAAYREVLEFKHARTWDPRGWFWSPAAGAADRLAQL